MVYPDVYCQLCGVSFNIGRIRTRDEPRSAAFKGAPRYWAQARNFYEDPDQQDEDKSPDEEERELLAESQATEPECSDQTGCCMVYREPDPSQYGRFSYPHLYDRKPQSDCEEADPSFQYESDSDYDALEYDSAASDDHQTDRDDDPREEEDERASVNNNPSDEPEWTFRAPSPPVEYDTEFLPLSTPLGMRLSTRNGSLYRQNTEAVIKANHMEHIAGPDCQSRSGYHGMRLSVEEARNCHTVQCLLRKDAEWQPSPDDLDFERTSKHCLTGVADSMLNIGGLKFAPRRRCPEFVEAETNFVFERSSRELETIGLPFHPACFEIFMQASRRFLGRVDIDSLMKMRNSCARQLKPFPVAYHEDVLQGPDPNGTWQHHPGHEYLAANPVFIPGLRPILEASMATDPDFSVFSSPFDVRGQDRERPPTPDPFLAFPAEIILAIVDHLGSRDVAALRHSSRAFTHLPNVLWRRLIVEELPWLYEAWSSDPTPYYWATVIAHDLVKEQEEKETWGWDFERKVKAIEQEIPAVYDQWVQENSGWHWPDHPDRQELLDLQPIKLPYARTNWYSLYRKITANKMQMKGLRNRERIWNDVMQIIKVIRRHHSRRRKQ